MYGVRTEETMADRALINRYDYDGIFGTGELNLRGYCSMLSVAKGCKGQVTSHFQQGGGCLCLERVANADSLDAD